MMVLGFYVLVMVAVSLRTSLCFLTEEEILQRVETNVNSPSVRNTRLTQHLITRYQVSHLLQCSQFCYLTKGCQSYNYYEDEGICELNDQTYVQGLSDFSFRTRQDPGWEYCDRYSFYMIRPWWYECSTQNPCQNGGVCTRKVLKGTEVERPPCVQPLCVCPVGCSGRHCSTQDCQEGNGASNRGKVPLTNTGKICQRWDSQTPHGHSKTPANYPSSGLEQNYCRNPDGEAGVWCYTTDPDTRWELCDVPVCGEG
ncbi:HGF [Branchiostoma lanceolatum]|uniref:HGF protein n=1 Tax=Branchiostoma lanceolatum TaxID=7740 RepID=A0A8K0A854_BRALA|nr:HGF [Branchiostoma lanceolatum]